MLHLSSIVVCFISSQVTLTCSLRPLGPSQQQDIKELVDYVRSQKADADTLVISEPQTERFNRAVAKFNFIKDAAIWENKPSADELHTRPQPHVWLRSKEDSDENRARYMEYLRNPNDQLKGKRRFPLAAGYTA